MSVPTPPTPSMPGESRKYIYGVWGWLSVLVGALIVGWAVVGDAPAILMAVSVGLNFVGAACGFLAKNNVG